MKITVLVLGLLLGSLLVGCDKVMDSRYESAQAPVIGPQGPAGAPGSSIVGPQGVVGPMGPSGPSGSSIVGPLGPTGPSGAAGVAGATGSSGAAGKAGSNGTNGNGYNPGLECDVYSVKVADENGTVNWDTLLNDGTLEFTTVLANFNVPNQSSNDVFASFTTAQQALIGTTNYALDCSGTIDIPETSEYTFLQSSDDGSLLALDDVTLINMPDLQPMTSKSAQVQLFAGAHKINVIYFQGPPTNIGLQLYWQGPSNAGLGSSTIIPSSVFTH